MQKKRDSISDSRLFAGNVITPANRREFIEKQAELYKEQYLRANKDKEKMSDAKLEQTALGYGRHMANKEVKHFKSFIKGELNYKYKGISFPVLTKESIKSARKAEDIVEINTPETIPLEENK
jgi:hypothetical protein